MNRIFRPFFYFFCRSHSNTKMILWPCGQLRNAVATIRSSKNRGLFARCYFLCLFGNLPSCLTSYCCARARRRTGFFCNVSPHLSN